MGLIPVLLFLQMSIASAHSLRIPKDTSGLSVPALSHGQMSVISDYRSEIHSLAVWVAVKDRDIAKLLTFSREQYRRCLWGMMPASIEDEASPMNECSHAYLAADRSMLVRMKELPFWRDKALALYERIELAMIAQNSSVVLCVFSATDFNTASPVDPDWHDFLLHKPSLITVAGSGFGLAGLLTGGSWLLIGKKRYGSLRGGDRARF